jgi:hypothetical protein
LAGTSEGQNSNQPDSKNATTIDPHNTVSFYYQFKFILMCKSSHAITGSPDSSSQEPKAKSQGLGFQMTR